MVLQYVHDFAGEFCKCPTNHWMITPGSWLGCFDIYYAVKALVGSTWMRQGHLNAMKRVFGYLQKRPKGRLLRDIHTIYPDHSKNDADVKHDWEEFYPDAEEE